LKQVATEVGLLGNLRAVTAMARATGIRVFTRAAPPLAAR
jgi:hypothetical protein